MKTTSLLLVALLGTAAFATQAQELYTPGYQQQGSGLTRAQVKQSVLRAQKAGELNHNDVDQPAVEGPAFGKTRSQVESEVLAARSSGALSHDEVDLPNVASRAAPTRKEVRDEAVASRQLVKLAPGRNTIDY